MMKVGMPRSLILYVSGLSRAEGARCVSVCSCYTLAHKCRVVARKSVSRAFGQSRVTTATSEVHTGRFCVHIQMPTLYKCSSKTNSVCCSVNTSSDRGSSVLLSVYTEDALTHSVESPAQNPVHTVIM